MVTSGLGSDYFYDGYKRQCFHKHNRLRHAQTASGDDGRRGIRTSPRSLSFTGDPRGLYMWSDNVPHVHNFNAIAQRVSEQRMRREYNALRVREITQGGCQHAEGPRAVAEAKSQLPLPSAHHSSVCAFQTSKEHRPHIAASCDCYPCVSAR